MGIAPGNREKMQDIVCAAGNGGINDNHSIAYCLLGYLCAYYRYYHPVEFITSFLNNAANDDDIRSGSMLARQKGIQITMPKWGVSKEDYFYDAEKGVIAKGLSSIKYMSAAVAKELYAMAKGKTYKYFVDLLADLDEHSSINSRQIEVLTSIDFFSEFGNQRELTYITELFSETFKKGQAKQVKKSLVEGTPLDAIIQRHAVGVTKSGGIAKSYTLLDVTSILHEAEEQVKATQMEDYSDIYKVKKFFEIMGYMGYITNKEEDRRKLYILEAKPAIRKSDGKQFGQNILTKSIGSGKESWFTVATKLFWEKPVAKGDLIFCESFTKEGSYYRLTGYRKIG